MRRITLSIGLAALLAGCAGPIGPGDAPQGAIHATATGQRLDPEVLVGELAEADIVIVGEVHDNADHHAAQAWLVGRLAPRGLAFEMIPTASEEGVAAFLTEGGAPADIGPAIGWERLGWPDWSLYRPILAAAEPAVVTGGGLSRSQIRRAIATSAYLIVPDRRFQALLAAPQHPEIQMAMEAEMIDAHCGKLPASAAAGMVEVQRLRDASFAAAALRAYEAQGKHVVLITGNGHARIDRGVPIYLSTVAPRLRVLSVGQIETKRALDRAELAKLPYDYVWIFPPAERPDPCLAFD